MFIGYADLFADEIAEICPERDRLTGPRRCHAEWEQDLLAITKCLQAEEFEAVRHRKVEGRRRHILRSRDLDLRREARIAGAAPIGLPAGLQGDFDAERQSFRVARGADRRYKPHLRLVRTGRIQASRILRRGRGNSRNKPDSRQNQGAPSRACDMSEAIHHLPTFGADYTFVTRSFTGTKRVCVISPPSMLEPWGVGTAENSSPTGW